MFFASVTADFLMDQMETSGPKTGRSGTFLTHILGHILCDISLTQPLGKNAK
jgi:hypothetical protein